MPDEAEIQKKLHMIFSSGEIKKIIAVSESIEALFESLTVNRPKAPVPYPSKRALDAHR